MATLNTTNIPAPRVSVIDDRTGLISREWYMYFFNQYVQSARSYGTFYSTETQDYGDAGAVNVVKFDVAQIGAGVSVDPDQTTLRVNGNGIYTLQYELQFVNLHVQTHVADVWVRKNGVDAPYSSTQVTLAGAQGYTNGYTTATGSATLDMGADDTFDLVWSADNTAVRVQGFAAGTAQPAGPSALLTIAKVS